MAKPIHICGNRYYFSGENIIQKVNHYIQDYEIRTLSRFIKINSKGFAKPERCQLKRKPFWSSSCKELPIDFDGVPFVILGRQIQECFNGPDRHRARKKKDKDRKQQEDHDYHMKSRNWIQTSKKMDCPAAIHLRSVVRFPTYLVNKNSGRAKRRIAKQLRADIADDGKEVPWEHRVYMALPSVDTHQHHLVDDMGCMTHDVHANVISKIHLLVADGVRDVGEMKRHISAFSKTNYPTVPLTSNRYYPNSKCLRNHMHAALSMSQLSTEDQENLRQHVEKWKVEMPDDRFHFVPSPNPENDEGDVENFIFVHQTGWQRHLLSRYGNEICLLDATYKVCKCDVAMFFLCVSTNVGYVTVGCFLLPSETVENITCGLRQLKQWNPEWTPSFFMTDYDMKEIRSIETVFPHCFTYLCDFHREQAWDRWLKTSSNGVAEHKTDLLHMMRAIAHAASDDSYQDAVTSLKESPYWQNNERLQIWFEKQWLSASKRWVHYHRQSLLNVRVSTTNGLERQHYELKHHHLSQYTEGSLTSLTTTVVTQFIPEGIRRYREKNVQCLESSRVYSTDIPLFLRNRPRLFLEHCVKRLPSANDIPEENITVLPDKKLEVVSEDTSAVYVLDLEASLPRCSCPDWFKTHLPCKHMLCAIIKVPDHGWDTLSKEYTESPHLCLDKYVTSIESDRVEFLKARVNSG